MPETTERVTIKRPNLQTIKLTIVNSDCSPYVQNKFSQKAQNQIRATQEAGGQAKSKKHREPKDFDAAYEGAIHRTKDGWIGIPAAAFRSAMIAVCRLVGYKMTFAKMSVFVLADGIDETSGDPLVRIVGEPEKHEAAVRNDNGSCDLRLRPMWRKWSASLRIKYDADQFSAEDVVNLLSRAGAQCGVGEGRAFGKEPDGAGMGWGHFDVVTDGGK
jgi:hypothetical protein